MKRYIKSATQYPNYMKLERGRNKFAVYYTDPNDFGDMKAAVSEIHPYDDADYAWAKIEGLKVTFYNSKGVLDTMHLWSYEPDEYEDITEYVNDVLDTVCTDLLELNKSVAPVMVHN